jgi:hypothetical protein
MAKKPARRAMQKRPQTEILDPRQAAFLAAYIDPKSPTYSNALQSALSAGYSQQYAENITSLLPEWLSERIGNDRRVQLAEAHFDEILAMPVRVQAMGAFGPIFAKQESKVKVKLKNGKVKEKRVIKKTPVMVFASSLIKEKTNVSKIIVEAHNPAYAKKSGPKISFTFNAKDARARYDSK